MKIPNALHRFNWEYRPIRDERGNTIAHAVPLDTDKRTPRQRMAGKDTTGFLVVHHGRNRARRRELGRQYGVRIGGDNQPQIGKLTFDQIDAMP